MICKITIRMDNDGFKSPCGGNYSEISQGEELGNILHDLAEKCEIRGVCCSRQFIARDSNGNEVGQLVIEEDV